MAPHCLRENVTHNLTNAAVRVINGPDAVTCSAAQWLMECIRSNGDRTSAICLSGRQIPRLFYAALTAPPYGDALPWMRIHLFWTDGRFVPPTDERNNYKIARDFLFTRVPIPCENIHAIPTTEKTPSAAAPAYEEEITRFHGMSELAPDRPLFDVTFHGIGEEGHTASLFPGSRLLEQRSCWVAAVPHGVPEARVALAYPALESSCRVVFAVTVPRSARWCRR